MEHQIESGHAPKLNRKAQVNEYCSKRPGRDILKQCGKPSALKTLYVWPVTLVRFHFLSLWLSRIITHFLSSGVCYRRRQGCPAVFLLCVRSFGTVNTSCPKIAESVNVLLVKRRASTKLSAIKFLAFLSKMNLYLPVKSSLKLLNHDYSSSKSSLLVHSFVHFPVISPIRAANSQKDPFPRFLKMYRDSTTSDSCKNFATIYLTWFNGSSLFYSHDNCRRCAASEEELVTSGDTGGLDYCNPTVHNLTLSPELRVSYKKMYTKSLAWKATVKL